MAYAGKYSDRLRVLQRTTTRDDLTGEIIESFEGENYLWCRVEINTSRRQNEIGSPRTAQEATIYVRNYPSITSLDRLKDESWNNIWVIDSIKRGDNELILDCYAFDDNIPIEDQ